VRVVIDTNVLLSGLLWHGTPHALIEQIRSGTLTLISSPALFAELADVITRPKFRAILARSNIDPERMLAALGQLAEIVDPLPLPTKVSHDSDDDAVLALAVAAQADLVVSGDADLLTLGVHAGIRIVRPAEAFAIISSGGSRAEERERRGPPPSRSTSGTVGGRAGTARLCPPHFDYLAVPRGDDIFCRGFCP